MISELINMSTGPVSLSTQVMNALKEPAISHRSLAFKQLYNRTTNLLCTAFNVKETFVLTGSGTLANEVMLQQIKSIDGPGLILSNGEFGSRLMEQSHRNNINFISYKLEWGKPFNLKDIETIILLQSVTWILFCHCETSTGVINDLDGISSLASLHKCRCYVDCMSTVGTIPLDLSKVSMATASSGKGLASIPGLAIIFSNIQLATQNPAPVYLDLAHYATHSGIPFTISSNLLKALYISIQQKLTPIQFDLLKEYSKQFQKILTDHRLLPFIQPSAKVFTIAAPVIKNKNFIKEIRKHNMVISYESDYLKARGFCQLACFGYYKEKQLKHVVRFLKNMDWQM